MKMNAFDRFTLAIAPKWTLQRVRARAAAEMVRSYDAAQYSRRNSGWQRNKGDVNSLLGVAGPELRLHARNLVRNNSWAKHGQETVANDAVGWGITPRASSEDKTANAKAIQLWEDWADTTEIDADGRSTFAGIATLAMKSIFSDGEVLLRRRYRRPADGLTLPVQVQTLEADLLDSNKDGPAPFGPGWIINGVEFDGIGRRVAYWLFDEHPGSGLQIGVSKRIPAKDIRHVFLPGRPDQVRGASWLASAIVTLSDLDEFEDAELMKQKIAACFAAFVTDEQGDALNIAGENADDDTLEQFEPGMIKQLPPGKKVTMANPPVMTSDSMPMRNLRKVAAGIGISYEALTGDYSQVNFSSARMARLAYLGNLRSWQWNMLIPQLCQGVWQWAMEAAVLTGELQEVPRVRWTVTPLPLIEPDKEARAYKDLVRNGAMTPSEMVRELGGDPDRHFVEYAEDFALLDKLKIQLDCDVRAVSAAGLTQVRAGAGPGEKPPPEPERASDEVLTAMLRSLQGGKE